MTGPQQRPRWRAMEMGPGGLAPEQVRPIGGQWASAPDRAAAVSLGAAPPSAAGHGATQDGGKAQGAANPSAANPSAAERGAAERGAAQWWFDGVSHGFGSPAAGPSAVFGSFEDEPRRPRWRGLGWFALAVAIAVVAAAALWSTPSEPTAASGNLRPGDCLSSSAGTAVTPVDCSSPDVEFRIAARFDGSTDSTRCAAVSSDLVLVTRDHAVLCLNYLAAVGECLYAGAARTVGKAPCRTAGSSSTPIGLFRVIAVLDGTVDARDCPAGTVQSLVHPTSNEVLCLGLP